MKKILSEKFDKEKESKINFDRMYENRLNKDLYNMNGNHERRVEEAIQIKRYKNNISKHLKSN